MGFLAQLLIGGALIAGVLFAVHTAWSNFTGSYIKIGADKQLQADTVVIDQVKADRDQWKKAEQEREAELATQKQAIDTANAAMERLNKRAEQLIAVNKTIVARQSSSRVKFEQSQARDRGIVLTPQPKRPAEQDLALIDGVTSEALDALGLSKKKPEAAK